MLRYVVSTTEEMKADMKTQDKVASASETLVLKFSLGNTDSERIVALPPFLAVEDLLAIALQLFSFDGGHLSKITRKDGWKSTVLPDFDGNDDVFEDEDETVWSTPIGDFLPVRGAKAAIDYDFGDGWKIVVTRMADKAKAKPFTCIKSRGPDAVEDCGGPWGLESLLQELDRWIVASKKERLEFRESLLDWAFELESMTEEKALRLLEGPTAEEITGFLQGFAEEGE